MSVSTEVQRTLVKSPPELWSELSNPDALARHLAELGEVRITSVEPETKVEWEAEGASGIVQLKQSGWGTKVTLSVTRIPPELEAKAELESIAKSRPDPEPTPEAELEPEAAPAVEEAPSGSEAIAEPEPTGETEPVAALAEQETVTEPDTRPGFFARLFGRGHARRRALAEALAEFDAVTEPKLEIVALAAPEPVYPEPAIEPEPQAAAEPTSDLAAELASVEAQMAQETTELLTGVLDRLGAAHHRPFSRG